MSQPSTIDQLRSARDTALAALKSSIDASAKEIEVATDPDEAALNQRLDNLVNQSDAIETAATDAVLALPEVIAAAATLHALSAQMTKTAPATLYGRQLAGHDRNSFGPWSTILWDAL
jgi:hypothetical protein